MTAGWNPIEVSDMAKPHMLGKWILMEEEHDTGKTSSLFQLRYVSYSSLMTRFHDGLCWRHVYIGNAFTPKLFVQEEQTGEQ